MSKISGVTNVLHTTRPIHTNLIKENKPQEALTRSIPWYRKAATAAALYFALPAAGVLFNANEVDAANNPEKEKAVVKLAQESWTPLKEALDRPDQTKKLEDVVTNSNSLWNNIQAVLHVTDDTMVKDMDSLRLEILKRGTKDPNIPPRLVHSALYTLGVSSKGINEAILLKEKEVSELKKQQEELQKKTTEIEVLKVAIPEELKARGLELTQKINSIGAETSELKQRVNGVSSHVLPYMGKVIVDVTRKDGGRERHLLKPEGVNYLRGGYTSSKVYAPRNFDKLAGYVIAQLGEGDMSRRLADELLSSGNDLVRRREFFDVFYNTNPSSVPQNVREKSLEWVFGKEQIDGLKKQDKKDGKTSTIIIAPAPPEIMPPAKEAKKDGALNPKSNPPPGSVTIQLPPGTVIQQTLPTTPGIPKGVSTGSLEQLTELDKRLTAIYLPYYASRDASDQQFMADNILMLTQGKDMLTVTVEGKEQKIEASLVASAQWFALKAYSETSERGFSDADYTVLRSLAIMAKDNKLALDVLKRTLGSFPDLYLNAYFSGVFRLNDRADRRAGVEIISALNANKESAREFLISLADRKAPLIWKEPTSEENIKQVNDARDTGRRYALTTMAFVDESYSFVPYMRGVVQNPFSKTGDQLTAIIGVALARDKESIDTLLKVGMDETKNDWTRALSMEAVLYIDTPDLVPDSIRKKAASESPFSPSKLQYAYPVRTKGLSVGDERPVQEILDQIEKVGPFRSRIRTLYNTWLEQETKLANSQAQKGKQPTQITNLQKLEVLMELRKQEFGGTRGLISAKSNDATFKTQLDSMVRYLDGCKEKTNKRINLDLALPMMDLLAKAGNEKASPVLADIATYPEQYVRTNPDATGFFAFFDLFDYIFESTILKMVALEDMGGTCNLSDTKDRASEVIHQIARKDTSRIYRGATQRGLRMLADRYDEALTPGRDGKAIAIPELAQKVMAARQHHAEQALGHMKYHALGLEDIGQMRYYALADEFGWAKIVDRLGGTKDLLTYALEKSKDNQNAQVVRSAMHALRGNGRKVEDIGKLDFEPKSADRLAQLYNHVNKQEFWVSDNHKKQTGKGVDFAVIDAGYVYPLEQIYPGIEKKIIYPEKMIRWSDMTEWLDLHPSMVAGTFHQMAGDPTIRTYSFLASIPEVPFRPFETQDQAMLALEDMAQMQIEGKANIDVVNYSWGYINAILAMPSLRNEVIDLLGAFMEVNSRLGTKHTVAAGNENGMFPGFVRWANQGELNTTGLRYDNSGKASRPDSVFFAGAMDSYANMLAEFSSVNDPLRTLEAIQLLSYQGVHVMAPYVQDRQWVLHPVNGTSFAAPSNAFLLAWGMSARRAASLPDLSAKEWQQLLDKTATKRLPHREDWEGGRYLDVTAYLVEVLRPPQAANQPAQQPAIANKKE
jgi:hypothetical protein